MKLFLILFAAFLFVPTLARAQTKLPRTYLFKKESSKYGSLYHIEPTEFEGDEKSELPRRSLAATVMPGLHSGGLIFINTQKERQLSTQTDKSAVITYDSKQLKDLQFDDLGVDDTDETVIKTEGAALAIDLKDLLEIIKADRITATFGTVVYQLDEDNIAAFHYLAEQIEKDSKPAAKRKPPAKAVRRKSRQSAKRTK